MRLGIMLSMPGDTTTVAGLVERARQAEADGFASAWLPQVMGVDALTVLALAGAQTSRIHLGTAVVPTYPRHPSVLAGQALTVNAATGGRLTLGIGLSHKVVIENALGLDYSKPVPHMREYLTVLNGLLTGEPVNFDGDLYRVHVQVNVPQATKPPVVVAALGPAMLKLCGRLADGTITWMGGLPYLRDVAVPIISASAAEAGRPTPRIVAMVPICLTDDVAAARETLNKTYRMYGQLPSYRAALDRGGAENPADVAIIGNADQVVEQLHEYARAGVTDLSVALTPGPGGNAEATSELLSRLAREGIS
ncbi:MAG: LLM class F420-dependent oxidoreductase [Anaerolinea sp.]|nr:LLM class F420-dependent oxidoreductase [Anaerolinea sp.]